MSPISEDCDYGRHSDCKRCGCTCHPTHLVKALWRDFTQDRPERGPQ